IEGDPQFDPGMRMLVKRIVDEDPLDRIHLMVGDPVPAYLVWPEGPGRQPVGVKTAGLHPFEPVGLDDMDAAGIALAEEAFVVLGCGPGHRPDASAGAVAGEPEG